MSSEKTHVLLTIAGRKSYVYTSLRSSARAGRIIATDADPRAPIRACDAIFEQVPLLSDERAYLRAIEACVKKHAIDCIIPLNDRDLALLSRHAPVFAGLGACYLGAPADITEALTDKLVAAEWLSSRGFLTPETVTVSSVLAEDRGSLYPLITKARRGQGSEGFRILANEADLRSLPQDSIVQPLLEGVHYDLDVLRSGDGDVLAVVPKRKLEMSGGTAQLVESELNSELIALGIEVANATAHVGVIDVDVIAVGSKLYVLEINPRLGGCFAFTSLVCPAFTDAYLAVGRGENPTPFLGQFRSGVKMFREWHFMEVPPLQGE